VAVYGRALPCVSWIHAALCFAKAGWALRYVDNCFSRDPRRKRERWSDVSLSVVTQPNVTERLDRIVNDVVARAVRLVGPQRVWLFGSQAAGTATRASDVDLAFELQPSAMGRWAEFVIEATEEVPALVDLDLVDINSCAPAFAREITTTGRVVYESPR
jgi:predicted nucleotidyltransferase